MTSMKDSLDVNIHNEVEVSRLDRVMREDIGLAGNPSRLNEDINPFRGGSWCWW